MTITSQASHFFNAYLVLRDHETELRKLRQRRSREHHLPNSRSITDEIGQATDPQTGVVSFVCLAFSVELYLKAVFEVLGKKQRGHNIRTLFEKLPPDTQNQILELFIGKPKKPDREIISGLTLETFKERLNLIGKGFEEFRYAYEYQELLYHQDFALKFVSAMKQLISNERQRSSSR